MVKVVETPGRISALEGDTARGTVDGVVGLLTAPLQLTNIGKTSVASSEPALFSKSPQGRLCWPVVFIIACCMFSPIRQKMWPLTNYNGVSVSNPVLPRVYQTVANQLHVTFDLVLPVLAFGEIDAG